MDILQYLKGKKEQTEGRVQHPIAKRNSKFKYNYCLGLGVMAMGNMKAITETREYFEDLLCRIELPREDYTNIISDINNYFDSKLKDILDNLVSKQDKYQFLADLYLIYEKTLWAQSYCKQVMANYEQMMELTRSETAFFSGFYNLAHKKQLQEARRCYEDFKSEGYEVSYQTLIYLFPEFSLEETYEQDVIIETGKTLLLDKPVTIRGNVTIQNGASLLVRGALLNLEGSIIVDGGRIVIRHSRVVAKGNARDFLVRIHHTAVVAVENSYVDCMGLCGFLHQEKGQLSLADTRILHTAGQRAVVFSGTAASIRDVSFHTCSNGGLYIQNLAKAVVQSCIFIHCSENYGGAVYSESLENVKITGCEFQDCQAKYIGAAIYFKYEKFGQIVKDCHLNGCEPQDTAIFNSYADDIEL